MPKPSDHNKELTAIPTEKEKATLESYLEKLGEIEALKLHFNTHRREVENSLLRDRATVRSQEASTAMAGMNSAEKRMVVITKESMFYVPEDGSSVSNTSPILTRSVSKTSPSKTGSLLLEEPDGGSKSSEKPGTKQALCLFGMCVLLLVVLCLLLLVYCRRDTAPQHSILVAVVAGALGYTFSRAQRILS